MLGGCFLHRTIDRSMLLTKYGLKQWLIILITGAVLTALPLLVGWWWLSIVFAVVTLAMLSFFRDPIRRIRTDLPPGTMLSPADGVISAVEHVDAHDAVDGPAVIIRIFLSVLNVHVNRWPYDGTVVDTRYKPGEFLNAQTPESAKVNESNLIFFEGFHPDGSTERMGLRQVSGMVARCIVCPITPGETFKRGEKFGMIKFGSTTELILPRPDDVAVHVEQGTKVRAGLTIIATINLPES